MLTTEPANLAASPTETVAIPGSAEALYEAAVAWARRGFPVFPLIPGGKIPANPGWQASATTNEVTIRSMWWTRDWVDPVTGEVVERCHPYNIGYTTDDLVVIDIDTKFDVDAKGVYERELYGDFDTLEVRTTSGGTHLIYANPDRDRATRVKLEKLPIDIKAVGGLAVAPGSVFAGGTYALAVDRPIKLLPAHLKQRIPKARARFQNVGVSEADLDKPGAVEAMARLASHFQPADKGSRGSTCYKLALELRDQGLSVDTATSVIAEYWAYRCDPPFALEDEKHGAEVVQGVATTVEHAYRYAQNAVGSKAPETVFDRPVVMPDSEDGTPAINPNGSHSIVPQPFTATPFDDDDSLPIPPRRYVYGAFLTRGFVTELVAPGGVGKSTLSSAVAMAVALNRNLLAASPADSRHRVRKSGPIYVLNGEDSLEEMRRRWRALRWNFKVASSDLSGRVYMDSGRDKSLKLAIREVNTVVASAIVKGLIAELKRLGIVLLIIDPLVSFHQNSENDNGEMDFFMRILSTIAHEADVAVLVVHHTKKGAVAGDSDSSRGAGAIKDAARSQQTLAAMTAEEAKKLGLENRKQYIRLDDGKMNLAPQVDRAEWFRLVSVHLRNGTPEYPEGDHVQAIERWQPPVHGPLTSAETHALLRRIEEGPEPGEFYALSSKTKRYWAGHAVLEMIGGTNESHADMIIKDLRKAEFVVEGTYTSTARGSKKNSPRLTVDWSKVPAIQDADDDEEGSL